MAANCVFRGPVSCRFETVQAWFRHRPGRQEEPSVRECVLAAGGWLHILAGFVNMCAAAARRGEASWRVVLGAEMPKGFPDHPGIINHGDDPHRALKPTAPRSAGFFRHLGEVSASLAAHQLHSLAFEGAAFCRQAILQRLRHGLEHGLHTNFSSPAACGKQPGTSAFLPLPSTMSAC